MRDEYTISNITAAIASFLIPGLGQFIQKRAYIGLLHLLLAAALWVTIMYLGWIIHIWSAIDAARFKMIDDKSDKSKTYES